MTRTLNTGLLTLAILLFLGLEETTEACSCFPFHPQQAFCSAEYVIKAKVTGSETIYDGTFPVWTKYTIKKVKFFKGECEEVDSVITPYFSATCGAHLETNGTDYLLSGHKNREGKFQISSCGFNVQWDSLTNAQRLGVMQRYRKGCECTIQSCFSLPCESTDPKVCLWTDMVFDQQQDKQSYCVMRKNDTCVWYKGPKDQNRRKMGINSIGNAVV